MPARASRESPVQWHCKLDTERFSGLHIMQAARVNRVANAAFHSSFQLTRERKRVAFSLVCLSQLLAAKTDEGTFSDGAGSPTVSWRRVANYRRRRRGLRPRALLLKGWASAVRRHYEGTNIFNGGKKCSLCRRLGRI